MVNVKKGDTVKVHYEGRFEDGHVFDSTKERYPIQFQIGQTKLPPGMEDALIDMKPGQQKTITVLTDRELDPRRQTQMLNIERHNLPDETHLEVGQQMELRQANGRATVVRVTGLSDTNVTLQVDYYLPSQKLTLDIEVVEIV